MHRTKYCAAVLLCLAASGCVSQQEVSRMRADLDETKGRLLQAEKQLASVRTETKDEVEKNIKVSRQDIDTIRKGGADLQATLEGVRVDMQLLTGRIEDLALQVRKPTEDIQLLKEDVERKLAAIDEKSLKFAKELERIAKENEKFQGETQKKLAEMKDAPAVEQATPESLYKNAQDTLKAGNTAKARELFSKFLAENPKHDLASNARYWIGETYYNEKNFDTAILEFEKVIQNYPGKDKCSAALFKQGMAFVERGDVSSAKYAFRKLTESYPLSDEAKLAKEKLKQLK